MDWITQFMAETEKAATPTIFTKWGAISAIAAALERKVWVRTAKGTLYPNLYVVLVAPPGVGKTLITGKVRKLLKTLGKHHIAPSSVTKASLIDALASANRHIVRPNEVPASVIFNSLQLVSDELGVLLPKYDTEFMAVLTALYDNEPYSETRRTKDLNIEVKHPQLNILAGCPPAYLSSTLPEGAWDQGFISRTFLIYSGDRILAPIFGEAADTEFSDELKQRLRSIAELYGKASFSPEAAQRLENWYMNGEEPKPDHPKLVSYNSRRIAHALKLSMIASVSESDSLVVEDDHVARAIDWMIEAEHYMTEIFKAMNNTSHSQLIEEVWYYVFNTFNREGKKPVNERRVINFVQQRTPAHNVARVLEVMEKSGIIVREMAAGGIGYKPKGRVQ